MIVSKKSVKKNAKIEDIGLVIIRRRFASKLFMLGFITEQIMCWKQKRNCGVYCGSDIIEKNLILIIDLLLNVVYLFGQKRSDMGLDWSILAVVLGLQRILPKLDEFRDGLFKNQSNFD